MEEATLAMKHVDEAALALGEGPLAPGPMQRALRASRVRASGPGADASLVSSASRRDMSDAELLRAARLVLEPLVTAHAGLLCASFSDPLLYTFIPTDPPASIDALRRRYRRLEARRSPDGREQWLNRAMRLASAPIFVGLVEATMHADATASLAYFVFSDHARRGYGVEGAGGVVDHLFESLHVRAVRANIDTRNLASIRLVERLDFLPEKLILQADYFKGSASDERVFLRLEKTIDPSSLP